MKNKGRADQPSFESDRVNVELFDDLKLVIHVLQQTQHLQLYTHSQLSWRLVERNKTGRGSSWTSRPPKRRSLIYAIRLDLL